MENNERLRKIIRADFEEDDIKRLNVERLLESDFIDRFFGFAEVYDKVFGKNVFDSVTKWLSYGKEEYDYIKYFLNTSCFEYSLPFSVDDFISMSSDEIIEYQKKCAKIREILDEKRALYEEFSTFYE